MQRSILIFENTIKSSATRKTYLYHLNKFMLFFDVKDYDGLAVIPQEKLQIMMEDYVMHLLLERNQIQPPRFENYF